MGSTYKPFILFDGPATDGVAKIGLLNYIKYTLKDIETGKVEYSADGFSIGDHAFRYEALQTLEVADLRVQHKNGTLTTKYIRIVGKDGKEHVLIPQMVGGDTVRSLALKTEDLMKCLDGIRGKKDVTGVREQIEGGVVEKMKKMLAVSSRIRIDMMQRALGLDADTFSNKLFDWAAEFKFKVDGDFVVIEGGDVTGFISKLDAEFAEWNKSSHGKMISKK